MIEVDCYNLSNNFDVFSEWVDILVVIKDDVDVVLLIIVVDG